MSGNLHGPPLTGIPANYLNLNRYLARVLFATTALVASAGYAAADVAITGVAEMGVFGGYNSVTNTTTNLQFFTDVDVTFTMSGETDGGLTFGASIDLDESDGTNASTGGVSGLALTSNGIGNGVSGASGAFSEASQGGESIFISGSFGTLTMGDTDGALDFVVDDVAFGASMFDESTSHAGYYNQNAFDGANDGQVARYNYTLNNFTFAISAEIDDNGAGSILTGPPGNPTTTASTGATIYSIGVGYTAELASATLDFGLGYQAVNVAAGGAPPIGPRTFAAPGQYSQTAASVIASFNNGFTAGLTYANFSAPAGVVGADHYGIGLGYEMGAIAVAANYGRYNLTNGGWTEGFGATAEYDLGGGAVLQAGYGNSSNNTGANANRYSLGVAMSF